MRPLALATALVLVASCSTPAGQREPAPFARERGIVATSELPAGYVKLDPAAKNFLRVSGDPLVLAPSDEANGNVTLAIASRNHDMTMVSRLTLPSRIAPAGAVHRKSVNADYPLLPPS